MDEELRHLRKRVAREEYPTPRRICSVVVEISDEIDFVCNSVAEFVCGDDEGLQWFACRNHSTTPAKPIEEFFDEVRDVG